MQIKDEFQFSSILDEDGIEDWSKPLKRTTAKPAYHAAYQKDLRTIKSLGLDMTVKAYRESLK